MVNVTVLDVLGPLPSDYSCFIIASTREKMFGIQCSYADAEIAYGLLNNTALTSPYEFMAETFSKVGVQIKSATLESVPPCIYGKMLLQAPAMDKPLKIVSSSPVSVINSSLAAKVPLEINEEMNERILDCTIEYHRMKSVMGQLFPLPLIDKTDMLRLLSDLMDKIHFRQTSSI